MEFIKELDLLLFDNEVYKQILEENETKINLAFKIQTYVENELLFSLNDIMSTVTDTYGNRVNQAIFILLAQGIKSYKAGIILSMQGYFTNATMILRNLLEIIFNIKYILDDETKRFKRADNYLTAKNNWSGETAKLRAYSVLDRYLYHVYSIVCNYVHANYMGTAQNLSDDKQICISPSKEKITDSLNTLNAMYVYLLRFICEHYNLKMEKVNMFEQDSEVAGFIKGFDTEKEVLNMLTEMFRGEGFPDNFDKQFIKDYKKYITNKETQKKINRRIK